MYTAKGNRPGSHSQRLKHIFWVVLSCHHVQSSTKASSSDVKLYPCRAPVESILYARKFPLIPISGPLQPSAALRFPRHPLCYFITGIRVFILLTLMVDVVFTATLGLLKCRSKIAFFCPHLSIKPSASSTEPLQRRGLLYRCPLAAKCPN